MIQHTTHYVCMFPFSLVTEEGCRHCLPGWTLMNSLCYFFPFSEEISRRSWNDARQFCTRHGADLAVVDSREKHVRVKFSQCGYVRFFLIIFFCNGVRFSTLISKDVRNLCKTECDNLLIPFDIWPTSLIFLNLI